MRDRQSERTRDRQRDRERGVEREREIERGYKVAILELKSQDQYRL